MDDNILHRIRNKKHRDLIVTLYDYKKWSDFTKHLFELNKKGESFFWNLDSTPKTKPGKRFYIVFNNKVRCWLKIVSIKNDNGNITIELESNPKKPDSLFIIQNFEGIRYLLSDMLR